MKLLCGSMSSKLPAIYFVILFLLCTVTFDIAFCAEESTEGKGSYRMLVGDIEIIALSDGTNKRLIDQQAQLLQGDREKIKDMLVRAYPDEQMESTVNAYLINTGSKLVLIDTGNGKMGSPSMGNVVNNLRAAGCKPEQIDEVYLTHMHGDHVGGLVSGAERVFPNATVYANQREAEYWLSDSNRNEAPVDVRRTFQTVKTAITPYMIAGRFKTFDDNGSLPSGIRAGALFGHTPGHTAYFIESKGDTLVLCGDIIHVAAVQFADPSVTIAYDSDKAEAAKARQQFLAEAAENNWLIGGAHLAFPGLGYVRTNDDGGYVFVPADIPAVE
ncbi:MAG: fold metallo-hydrolase [Firmicutes bacterium]|nr:fold metallo-hydrolase [Bacillota bacterium]